MFLFQTLTKKFQYDYAHLWLSIINSDIEKLKEDTRRFDSDVYYGLLACVISGRSWSAIQKGVNMVKYTNFEVNKREQKPYNNLENIIS